MNSERFARASSSCRGWARLAVLGALGTVLLLALGACGAAQEPTPTPAKAPTTTAATPTSIPTPAPSVKEPKYGGVGVFATRADITGGGDPMRGTSITNMQVIESLYGYGNLVRTCRDDPYQRCAGLAESWEVSADFTVWTFKVRDNLSWHDGTPLSVEDLRWWVDVSIKGAKGRRPANNVSDFGSVRSVEVLDGNKLRITLKDPAPLYLLNFGFPTNVVGHPRHLVQPQIDKGNGEVRPEEIGYVGAGPFKFKEYVKGSVFSVRRFDKYWEKDAKGRQLPYLDGIDFAVIPAREAAVAAFRAGRLDATGRGNEIFWLPEQIEIVKRQMGDGVVFYPVISGYRTFTWNLLQPGPWMDVRVRRAASMVVDRNAGAKALYGELSKPVALFYPGSPFIDPDYMTWPGYNVATLEKDRADAKRLLAEAGFPNGFKTTLSCRSGEWVADCEFIAAQLRQHLNIQVTLDVVDDPTLTDRRCTGAHDMVVGGGGDSFAFPETGFGNVASVKAEPCGNLTHDDTKVDDFFVQIGKAKSFEERVRLSREMARYVLVDKVYAITTWTSVYPFAVRSYVQGIILPVTNQRDYLDHSTVWMDK